jgi:hypothetical protein
VTANELDDPASIPDKEAVIFFLFPKCSLKSFFSALDSTKKPGLGVT